jgi:hypothetical protein
MSIDLEALGLTKEDLQERLIDRLVHEVLTSNMTDEDGASFVSQSTFRRELDKKLKAHIDAAVASMAEQHVLPNVSQYIENLTLTETNRWGEKTGNTVTFIEYLVKRAEDYLTEKVDFQGRSKSETSGYGWNGTQTRVTHMVHQHLHYSIDTAMKQAITDANKVIVIGLQETVKQKLAEVSAKLKVDVKTT